MVVEETNILKIVKEDILRILGERKSEKNSLEFIKSEIVVSNLFISKAIEELKMKGLIEQKDHFFKLTKRGQKEGEDVFRKHLILEDYFKERRSGEEAHKVAHILEHYISGEVIDNIKELYTFRKNDIPLVSLDSNKESIITDINFPDYELFERMVSMGISLGKKITVTNEISGGFIVNVENKKFALDKKITEGIKVASCL